MLNRELKDIAWQVVFAANREQDLPDAHLAADIILLIEEIASLRTALRKEREKKKDDQPNLTELAS